MKIGTDAWESFHAKRFACLIETIEDYHVPFDSIAVFGAATETLRIKEEFPSSTVDAYGIVDPRYGYPVAGMKILDLNEPIRIDEHYNIGVCCEVVEHLDRPFREVLADMLRVCDIVIIQTPNAMSLWNRWWCAVRGSPHQYRRDKFNETGHVYEYTLKELTEGLPVVKIIARNYFVQLGRFHRLYNWCSNRLPMTLRDGFTIVYSR